MKSEGIEESCLQLLRDVTGAFRPGILTALVGVSGAGKTTLMDVLAGRKTGGYIEGSISISGYLRTKQLLLSIAVIVNRMISIHPMLLSMNLVYPVWLRLAKEVKQETRKACFFVQNIISFS